MKESKKGTYRRVRIVQLFTEVPGKTRLAYIEGPDGVLIELKQPFL